MVSSSSSSEVVFENGELDSGLSNSTMLDKSVFAKNEGTPVWRNLTYFGVFHAGAFYGLYLAFTSTKVATNIFAVFMYLTAGMGVTAGAHRLWSHRAYKAKWPLRVLLMFFNSMTPEGHILAWARDHRVHHKYSDTDADPYNARRGLFFSHFGWLLQRKHPDVIEKGRGIDMTDLYADPVLVFQKKFYWPLMITCCYVYPTLVPVYCWNESWWNAFFVPAVLRSALVLHATFCVNSIAHHFGYKPYDKNIRPVQNLAVAMVTQGEGWHNYHHAFPWDYKTSELGNYSVNFTNAFIDFFAWIGWAYDLKSVSSDVIKKRVQRTGDGSHELWGWGDKDLTKDDKDATVITHRNHLERT